MIYVITTGCKLICNLTMGAPLKTDQINEIMKHYFNNSSFENSKVL
jgi:hypothetical protein